MSEQSPDQLHSGIEPKAEMSQPQQQNGGPRTQQPPPTQAQAGSYPNTSYDPQAMPNNHFPSQSQQGSDAYRDSPAGSNGTMSVNSTQQYQPPPQQMAQSSYYPHPSGVQPMHQISYNGGMQYQLPQDPRAVMAGNRHKKASCSDGSSAPF